MHRRSRGCDAVSLGPGRGIERTQAKFVIAPDHIGQPVTAGQQRGAADPARPPSQPFTLGGWNKSCPCSAHVWASAGRLTEAARRLEHAQEPGAELDRTLHGSAKGDLGVEVAGSQDDAHDVPNGIAVVAELRGQRLQEAAPATPRRP